MKIAICISGQPRFFEKGFDSLKKKFLDKYDCDIFIHSWYDESFINKNFNTTHDGSLNIVGKMLKDSDKKIIKLYKPKNYVFEPYKNFNIPHKFTKENLRNNVNVNNIYSMFYSIQKSYEKFCDYRIKNKVEYDFLIRTRFDIQYLKELDLNSLDKEYINIPYECAHSSVYCDLFAISTWKNMEKYCNTYNNINFLYDPNKHFIGENILTDNINNQSGKVKKINYPLIVIRND